MAAILLHSSKTMRPLVKGESYAYQAPQLIEQARALANYLASLTPADIQSSMHLSEAKAAQTKRMIDDWTMDKSSLRPAINAFLGDIYSGLQVQTFSEKDRDYANAHLVILSGLYGGLRALDSIAPYRLEMGYKIAPRDYKNLYDFWSSSIANIITDPEIINLSAVEYTKAVLPHLPSARVVTPKFMTVNATSKQPTFVTVHAKIARGAFAHWLITNRIDSFDQLHRFDELNYHFDPSLSTDSEPVFVCESFGGLGLSVRLS